MPEKNCGEQDERNTGVGVMSLEALLIHQPSLSHFQGQIGKREKVMIRLQRLRSKEESRKIIAFQKF